jgi:hypothetical protein
MKTKGYQIVLALLLSIVSSGPGFAALVDFEGLGLKNGDSIPLIGVASFTASAARQGTEYAFVSSAGAGTGVSSPFNSLGNTFITNPGGLGSSLTKTIEISFSVPVYNFSFFAADIDSANPTIERLTATIFDASNYQLNQLSYEEKSFWSGDGNVIWFDFGGTSGIRRVTISLSNLATPSLSGIGFGVDNVEFQIAPQPVPLPSSMFLFGTGLAGLIGYVRLKTHRGA